MLLFTDAPQSRKSNFRKVSRKSLKSANQKSKVYKAVFYQSDKSDAPHLPLSNYKVSEYVRIDGQDREKHSGAAIDINSVKQELLKAGQYSGDFEICINRAVVECDYDEKDKIEIIFASEDEKLRSFVYKEAGKMPRIINSGRFGVLISGLDGRQKVYIKINDKYYDTNKIYDFGF